eukprot:CAMPEP_0204531734 /NCGR_PEP_ID=MMETSP0661-20131031/11329_1 /ASSEMBLY_ACC=CAM_ASM_000606 /TAXON_ID=109239 /ORGANISM="Alexandrium margalefi, Strain AMGDE01CS-322" /LENGTH=83 /DNA_ID=CAMNT_0051537907 /DNA_START=90 /DNA_END=338 /DNA_ORIENTATION=-
MGEASARRRQGVSAVRVYRRSASRKLQRDTWSYDAVSSEPCPRADPAQALYSSSGLYSSDSSHYLRMDGVRQDGSRMHASRGQ